MMECNSKVKKWGNSAGIVLPKDFIKSNGIAIDDNVRITIIKVEKKGNASKLWSKLKGWKTSSEKLEQFVDREFDIPV